MFLDPFLPHILLELGGLASDGSCATVSSASSSAPSKAICGCVLFLSPALCLLLSSGLYLILSFSSKAFSVPRLSGVSPV